MTRRLFCAWALALSLGVPPSALRAQVAQWRQLSDKAQALQQAGKYADANVLFLQALEAAERSAGPDSKEAAVVLHNIGVLDVMQARYDEAEPLFRRALSIQESVFGLDDPQVVVALDDLAQVYEFRQLYRQAEALYRRSLAIREQTAGPRQELLAGALSKLGVLYIRARQNGYATPDPAPYIERSLAIWEATLGPDSGEVAHALNNLSLVRADPAGNEKLLRRALAIDEKLYGPDSLALSVTLMNLLAQVASADEKSALYRRARAIRLKAYGPDHLESARLFNSEAEAGIRQSHYSDALESARSATAIYLRRIVSSVSDEASIREAAQNGAGFARHLSLLFINPEKEDAALVADEAFRVAQLRQASGTAAAVAKMAARFATHDDALAGLIKRKQEAGQRVGAAEAQLLAMEGLLSVQRNAANEQRVRAEIDAAKQDAAAIDAEIVTRFPQYRELTRAEPLSIKDVQSLLRPGEAMVMYVLSTPSYLWVVRNDAAVFLGRQIPPDEVAQKIATVRGEMDFDAGGQPKPVSIKLLHELYRTVFSQAIPHLKGVKHVMVVPAGPLVSLPFSMLVATPPEDGQVDYRQVDWLARHYAFSTLPSVGSIKAFRQFAGAVAAQQAPFAGFGDPLIGNPGAATRGRRAAPDVAGVFRNLVVAAGTKQSAGSLSSEIADVEAIRAAPRLPETAGELREMAKVLKSDARSLWLSENATETTVKRLDLSRYRTLAFATHGVMAGEVKGVGEPGLILTPPQTGTAEDDGYLSSGEIARLKLNADWVILSACNTASADGTPGAEGLSGLAKAFFYAGARSLLVSHWPVASEATVPLTTGMLREYEANPAQGKAEAHRKAMLKLIETPGHPEYAHPLFWAPFVVVGEGGAPPRPARAGR